MLVIYDENGNKDHIWHLGEPVPKIGRVVKFQADGDELNLFVEAMLASFDFVQGIGYTKQNGFIVKPKTKPKRNTRGKKG